MGLVHLMRVESGMEAEMVCALLREYDVRCIAAGLGFTTRGGIDDVLAAGRNLARDQFAPQQVLHEDDLELAKQVLAAPIDGDDTESEA